MAVDKWQTEEGLIVDGIVIGFCEAGTVITEGGPVKFGTAAAQKIVVAAGLAVGDSWGVALKAVVTGDMVPVATSGVIKMPATGTFAIGELVMNGLPYHAKFGQATTNTTALQLFAAAAASTGCHILGMALQTATTTADEVLILLGKEI